MSLRGTSLRALTLTVGVLDSQGGAVFAHTQLTLNNVQCDDCTAGTGGSLCVCVCICVFLFVFSGIDPGCVFGTTLTVVGNSSFDTCVAIADGGRNTERDIHTQR